LPRLRFVFGTSVVPALDLVDRQSVTRFVSPSGRTVYQCKHILAIYLSRATGACQEQNISDQQLSALLLPEEK
ncbi:PREDICTED: zinc finger SWIM domain-containing protein 7, partial [Thamnophis sirtalis]|uniref:Zinc finger SWIM domain-containing protein 7 n=1 Tax=Thamnophis sirtalis TaxID=35019 RepID=A0A6I9YCE6_9SAUR